jgi:hypothetical protein
MDYSPYGLRRMLGQEFDKVGGETVVPKHPTESVGFLN